MKAWTEKRIREARNLASLEYTVAIAGGMKRKGGGSLKLSDFLPEFAKEVRKQSSPEESEARLKAAMFKAATIKKPDGKEQ